MEPWSSWSRDKRRPPRGENAVLSTDSIPRNETAVMFSVTNLSHLFVQSQSQSTKFGVPGGNRWSICPMRVETLSYRMQLLNLVKSPSNSPRWSEPCTKQEPPGTAASKATHTGTTCAFAQIQSIPCGQNGSRGSLRFDRPSRAIPARTRSIQQDSPPLTFLIEALQSGVADAAHFDVHLHGSNATGVAAWLPRTLPPGSCRSTSRSRDSSRRT